MRSVRLAESVGRDHLTLRWLSTEDVVVTDREHQGLSNAPASICVERQEAEPAARAGSPGGTQPLAAEKRG